MAYDYLTWVSLKRPLTERERSRRIDVHRPVATDITDAHTVFSMNDTVLEVCDRAYSQQGARPRFPLFGHICLKGHPCASLSAWFFGLNNIGGIGYSARLFTLVLSGPLFVMAILHYIAQLTSREPIWPPLYRSRLQ
ncbi:hypothetical protein [Paraburkholderia kururiensis]|uniref:Uncharacterized protein n=1 Tax=Paraburkholderia kururiensis TaxID=984307 RepID=A0ABZ0WFB0_9BURK|nr:hypothetical protein [Paraburkholderia kururiensis]WQD76041.1 hypothetical protein U0042_18195 [Paraburkholderia kururiensis]